MNDGSGNVQRICTLAADYGLTSRGWFQIDASDTVPALKSGARATALLLLGQTGSAIWHSFSRSPEFSDGKAHPMDRWSYRTGCTLAREVGGKALFPFEGPPWYPFVQWAQRAESVRPSPLGILMHPEYGLWHAYRFAILLPASVEEQDQLETGASEQAPTRHACDSCQDKPCLRACPVNAFSNGVYDVASCTAYLRENEQAQCHQLGCLARNACPEGSSAAYERAHHRFHLQQFYAAHK